jgi:hypothetical protein
MDTAAPLKGQIAVVTGAGRGIGAAIARHLAALGGTAVLCGRTQSTLEETAATITDSGGKAEVIPCDVTVAHQLEHAAARIIGTQAGGSRSLFLPRHTNFEQLTSIARIFLRDSLRKQLHALKPASRIEKRALFAGVQFETTLRTLPLARAGRTLQYGSALSASRHCSRTWQVHRPRA